MKLENLKKSLTKAPIIKKGDYDYLIHPITDGIPEIQPILLEEITDEIIKHLQKIKNIDKIVTMEAMGIPLAATLSLKTRIPFTIIRKRSYQLPDEISVEQITGYSKSRLFINGLKKDDSIIIVDDVLSTGGTLRAVLEALEKMGVNVKAVFIAINKGEHLEKIQQEYNIKIQTIINIKIEKGKIVIKKGGS